MTSTPSPVADDLVDMEVRAVVRMEDREPTRFLVDFAEKGGDRRLPVFIGDAEAFAIAGALQGVTPPRPMTHDALRQAVDALGGRFARLLIGHRPETSTFTADVVIALPHGGEHHFDWRVSDAVAVALRCDPRPAILVPEDLLSLPKPAGTSVQLTCGSCGAVVPITTDHLSAVEGAPGFALADVDCPSCGFHHTVQLRWPVEEPTAERGPGGVRR